MWAITPDGFNPLPRLPALDLVQTVAGIASRDPARSAAIALSRLSDEALILNHVSILFPRSFEWNLGRRSGWLHAQVMRTRVPTIYNYRGTVSTSSSAQAGPPMHRFAQGEPWSWDLLASLYPHHQGFIDDVGIKVGSRVWPIFDRHRAASYQCKRRNPAWRKRD
jgi:hypothetical protein